jgi:hypothetical protein
VCGCNVADTDANGNGSPDCIDPTADTQPDDPLVDVTRIRQGGRTVYQVLAKLQQFGNRITYQVTMKGKKTRFKRTINKSKNVVGFRVPADTYTLSYVVKLGDVTTKETSITFKVPGGRRVSAARQATSHEGR